MLNTYGDLCGMTTLGALEIGGGVEDEEDEYGEGQMNNLAMAQGYDAQELLGYLSVAGKITNKITKLVRETWANRHREFGLLDEDLFMGNRVQRKGLAANENNHSDYIAQINQQMEENRKLHPSKEDDIEMNKETNEQEYDSKLIDLIQNSHDQKIADQQSTVKS